MQAVIAHGDGLLRYEDVPDPSADAAEVIVELRAAALNRRDLLVRDGFYGFPHAVIPGSDGAGIRRDSGEEVVIYPGFDWGDQEDVPASSFHTLGGPSHGTFAELVAVPAANVFPKPSQLSWQDAAALPVAGLTAYRALFTKARIRRGETVLILGIGGGVATFALVLARIAGTRVIVTSSSSAKLKSAVALGADAVVNHAESHWPDEVRALTGGQGVDVVIDSVGTTLPHSLDSLRPGGRCVSFGVTGGPRTELEIRRLYLRHLSLLGTTLGSPREFSALLKLAGSTDWKAAIDRAFPLADAALAADHLEAGRQFGKVILETV